MGTQKFQSLNIFVVAYFFLLKNGKNCFKGVNVVVSLYLHT